MALSWLKLWYIHIIIWIVKYIFSYCKGLSSVFYTFQFMHHTIPYQCTLFAISLLINAWFWECLTGNSFSYVMTNIIFCFLYKSIFCIHYLSSFSMLLLIYVALNVITFRRIVEQQFVRLHKEQQPTLFTWLSIIHH